MVQGMLQGMVGPFRRAVAFVPRPFAIALLAPAIVVTSAAILLGLLGIFVLWLFIVAALVAAIVVADITRRSMRRLAPSLVAPYGRSAVGVPGR